MLQPTTDTLTCFSASKSCIPPLVHRHYNHLGKRSKQGMGQGPSARSTGLGHSLRAHVSQVAGRAAALKPGGAQQAQSRGGQHAIIPCRQLGSPQHLQQSWESTCMVYSIRIISRCWLLQARCTECTCRSPDARCLCLGALGMAGARNHSPALSG